MRSIHMYAHEDFSNQSETWTSNLVRLKGGMHRFRSQRLYTTSRSTSQKEDSKHVPGGNLTSSFHLHRANSEPPRKPRSPPLKTQSYGTTRGRRSLPFSTPSFGSWHRCLRSHINRSLTSSCSRYSKPEQTRIDPSYKKNKLDPALNNDRGSLQEHTRLITVSAEPYSCCLVMAG
jgi:hypothetical protein